MVLIMNTLEAGQLANKYSHTFSTLDKEKQMSVCDVLSMPLFIVT